MRFVQHLNYLHALLFQALFQVQNMLVGGFHTGALCAYALQRQAVIP